MYIMASDPTQGISASEIETYFADKQSAQYLADAYAITHNAFWWFEDSEYDFEEGSPECKAACLITDEWDSLMKQYQSRIFDLLRGEGIEIPHTGQIAVLIPFMRKYGYEDQSGWWVKESR